MAWRCGATSRSGRGGAGSARGWLAGLLALGLGLLLVACAAPRPPRARHAEVVAALRDYAEAEMADKRIPGLALALVEGDEIVWAGGFGLADPVNGTRADADTIWRVGSVSKLFTDLAVMQLVERG
ncbi:MAG TPA: serine hydrolase domain-containing protein, partial [Planctomycetota bacterium]